MVKASYEVEVNALSPELSTPLFNTNYLAISYIYLYFLVSYFSIDLAHYLKSGLSPPI